MLRNSPPAVRAATLVLVLAAIAVSAFIGVSLVGGGDDGPSPPVGIGPTPPPGLDPERPDPLPTQDPSLPTQPADDTNRTPDPNATAPPLRFGDVSVPFPDGASLRSTVGDPGGHTTWSFYIGASFIRFDEYGLTRAEIAPPDEGTFKASLDALWLVAQENAQSSPATVDVGSVTVFLPAGSFYSTLDNFLAPDDPLYIVRLGHSVLTFDSSGVSTKSIQAKDADAFSATLTAVGVLTVDE